MGAHLVGHREYGFVIEHRDLEPPRTGIFDGLRITIDPDVGFEMQCFLLLHLFGHSVQWIAPSLTQTVSDLQNTSERSRFMQMLRDYEFDAARFGMQLMRECGVTSLDRWYSDFVETDWRYVERFYETDRIPPWTEHCERRLIDSAGADSATRAPARRSAVRVLSGERCDNPRKFLRPRNQPEMTGPLQHGFRGVRPDRRLPGQRDWNDAIERGLTSHH